MPLSCVTAPCCWGKLADHTCCGYDLVSLLASHTMVIHTCCLLQKYYVLLLMLWLVIFTIESEREFQFFLLSFLTRLQGLLSQKLRSVAVYQSSACDQSCYYSELNLILVNCIVMTKWK